MYIAFFFHREAQYRTLWGTICEMREIITDDFKNPGQIRDKNATCEIKNTRFEIKKKCEKIGHFTLHPFSQLVYAQAA